MSHDGASLREVMAAYPTGVTIVAGRDTDGVYGLTVNSFTSLSLDPPLVLVCIARSSMSHDRLVSGSSFAISLLAADQADIATRFARDPSDGRFEDIDWSPGPSGCPVVLGSVAWLDCQVHEILEGGDHSIVIGRVSETEVNDRSALLFHRGRMTGAEG